MGGDGQSGCYCYVLFLCLLAVSIKKAEQLVIKVIADVWRLCDLPVKAVSFGSEILVNVWFS